MVKTQTSRRKLTNNQHQPDDHPMMQHQPDAYVFDDRQDVEEND